MAVNPPEKWKHLYRWEPLAVRFARSYRVDERGCWIWTMRKNAQGYGHFPWRRGDKRFNWLAHRAAWRIHHGPIPPGTHVCHRCDVPSCVNPAHLFLGTQKDNMDDMVQKGRARRHLGGRPFAFDDCTMRAAVTTSESAADVAARLGISRSTVHRWRAQARQA